MNAEQKQFILEKWIPYIQRENGEAFAMSIWDSFDEGYVTGEECRADGILRKIPACGTVQCLGGSLAALLGHSPSASWDEFEQEKSEKTGLTLLELEGLFFNWGAGKEFANECHWPWEYKRRFAEAKTCQGKMEVVADLMREIADKGGKILHEGEDSQ